MILRRFWAFPLFKFRIKIDRQNPSDPKSIFFPYPSERPYGAPIEMIEARSIVEWKSYSNRKVFGSNDAKNKKVCGGDVESSSKRSSDACSVGSKFGKD